MYFYFTLKEFLKTDTGLPNLVDSDNAYYNLARLKYTLNIIRGIIGVPITITSGYRCPEVNSAVGGAEASYHLYGRAADITCEKMPELLDICIKLYDSGLLIECIYYPDKNIIHVAI